MNENIGESASCSTSFEFHASIGGDPDAGELGALFSETSKAVLSIEDEKNQMEARMRRNRRRSVGEIRTQLSTKVTIMDCDKLNASFSSEEDVQWFSILVNVDVTSSNGDFSRASTKAENLAFAAELAFENGEFEETLKNNRGSITILSVEMAPESSPNDGGYGMDEDDSSLGNDDLDFLEISYREYLQDQNRQDILARQEQSTSPSTVPDFPTEYPPYAKDMRNSDTKARSKQRVKFDPVVRVKNTLSRHDMSPNETHSYWSGEEELLTAEERDRVLKLLTVKWTHKKEQESKIKAEEDLFKTSPSLLLPILPSIKQLLPATEQECDDGYTYTIRIQG